MAAGDRTRSETFATNPISSYGLGKLMAEQGLAFVGWTKGAPYAILRVSNAIGRWQTNEMQGIVGVAMRATRDGIPVRLFGGGVQVRDFVDADDVAEAIYAASVDTTHLAATWNVGSGKGITNIDLMHRVSKIIGRAIVIEDVCRRAA